MNITGPSIPIPGEDPVLLRSFGTAWSFFNLDPISMRIRKVPTWRALLRRTGMVPRGWFGSLGGTPVALFWRGDGLNVLVGDKVFPIHEKMTARLSKQGDNHVLTMDVGSRGEVTVSYRRPKPWPPLEGDLTAGIEEEQHDYGLFLRNVIEDRDRQRRMLHRFRAAANADLT